MKKKIIYISHPIGGDVKNNIEKVLSVVRDLNIERDDIVPFAPYIVDCLALDDVIPEQRQRGIDNDISLFHSGVIDEVWLYGDRISAGMREEVKLAKELDIPVFAKTIQTYDELLSDKMLNYGKEDSGC